MVAGHVTTAFLAWQNPVHPCDVTDDGYVQPDDVHTLINDIASMTARSVVHA